MDDVERAVEWLSLTQVPAIIEKETGWRPTRETVYMWAKSRKLKTNGFRPLRTTRRWILDCLEARRVEFK